MNYIRTNNKRQQIWKALSFKGQTETFTIDYSPWSDNGTVTTVTVSLESGQASVGNESLTSNVKSLTITTAETGSSMIKLTATAGNNIDVSYLYIFSKDPIAFTEDYGICAR